MTPISAVCWAARPHRAETMDGLRLPLDKSEKRELAALRLRGFPRIGPGFMVEP